MLWGQEEDRVEGLRLAAMAAVRGAKTARQFLRDYDPPSVQLTEWLEPAPQATRRAPGGSAERYWQVMAVVRAVGGEAG